MFLLCYDFLFCQQVLHNFWDSLRAYLILYFYIRFFLGGGLVYCLVVLCVGGVLFTCIITIKKFFVQKISPFTKDNFLPKFSIESCINFWQCTQQQSKKNEKKNKPGKLTEEAHSGDQAQVFLFHVCSFSTSGEDLPLFLSACTGHSRHWQQTLEIGKLFLTNPVINPFFLGCGKNASKKTKKLFFAENWLDNTSPLCRN